MRIVVTGAAGFAGSHIVEHLLENTDWEIVCPVTFRHFGDSLRLTHLNSSRVRVIHHDLAGPISERLTEHIGPVDYIIHAAAQSHVDRSIGDPVPFITNNVAVTLTMLEYARLAKPRAFIQVSTDEVYGPAEPGTWHREWSPIIPSNPYSASKAAQEAIAISYWRTYSVPLVITNTMNLYGERQDGEKFVSGTIAKVHSGAPVEVHGDPATGATGSRHYIHARNHADALLFLLGRPPARWPDADRPDRYNVVGDREVSNLEMAQTIAGCVGRELDYRIVDVHSQRPGHDRRYALDGAKMKAAGWRAPVDFTESLQRTVHWTLANPAWL